MRKWDFTLIVDADLEDDALVEKLAAAGADDATFGIADGIPYADFTREAASFPVAVMSAIHDLEQVAPVAVVRLEPDDLVTLAEIARRLGRTRESVRLLASGRRGKGTFPPPLSHLRARSKLWRWSDVGRWAGIYSSDEELDALFVAMLNAALELRRLRHEAPGNEDGARIASQIAELAPA